MNDSSEQIVIPRSRKLLYALLPVVLLAGLAECTVRATGAATSCPAHAPFLVEGVWKCDPILEFQLDPSLELPDGERLNRQAFRGPDFSPRPPGVFRILALGDSCTFGVIADALTRLQYRKPYAAKLQQMADAALPGRIQVLNAGVPGYNSYHGLLLLRTKLRDLKPDLITVRFGWNDHFVTALPPGTAAYREARGWRLWLEDNLLLRTALYPFSRRVALELRMLRARPREKAPVVETYQPTVPLPDYEHNLRRIVEIGHERGAQVWLLTAPRNPRPSKRAINVTRSHNPGISFQDLMEVHDDYAEATRGVAAELGVPLVDMAHEYADRSEETLFDYWDVPHPDDAGHALEARVLLERLREQGILAAGSR